MGIFRIKATIGNPKIPWCPVCEDHTEYHLKEIRPGKTRAIYTCNECGSDTWKPTSPVLFGALVIAIIFGLNYLAFAVEMTPSTWMAQVEIWFFIIAALVTSIFLLALAWDNAKHWRKFNRWRKKLYQEKIDAALEQK